MWGLQSIGCDDTGLLLRLRTQRVGREVYLVQYSTRYAVYCRKIAEATLKNERTSSLEGNGNWTKTEMGDYLHVYDGRRDCIQSRLELFRD